MNILKEGTREDRRLAVHITGVLSSNLGLTVTCGGMLDIGQHEDLSFFVLYRPPGGKPREQSLGSDLERAIETFFEWRVQYQLGFDWEWVCPACQKPFLHKSSGTGTRKKSVLVCPQCKQWRTRFSNKMNPV